MLQVLKARREERDGEGGFTLIELMVVVLIIAVLLAIAIPTFLGSQNKAKDRSAQSSLRIALTSAESIFTDGSDYSAATNVTLGASEPSLSFVVTGTASTGPKLVSVNSGTTGSQVFYAASKSASGSCFYIKDDAAAGTSYSKGPSSETCSGTTAAGKTYSGTGWS